MPASFRNCTAPSGSSPRSLAPAPETSSVTDTGRLNSAQCQKPLAVGASGSYTVTAKLLVSGGNPDQVSCGEMSSPPSTPNTALACCAAIVVPSATSPLNTSKEG